MTVSMHIIPHNAKNIVTVEVDSLHHVTYLLLYGLRSIKIKQQVNSQMKQLKQVTNQHINAHHEQTNDRTFDRNMGLHLFSNNIYIYNNLLESTHFIHMF